MSHVLVTITAPIAAAKIEAALGLIKALQNPAEASLAASLDRLDGQDGIHFASLHAIPSGHLSDDRAHLLLEFSADGDDEGAAIIRLVDRIGPSLQPVFDLARDWSGGSLATYLAKHVVRIGQGWTGQAGLAFVGTPKMNVGRINQERDLANHLAGLVGRQLGGLSALTRLEAIRAEVRANATYRWALETPVSLPVESKVTILGLILPLSLSFIRTFLWPLAFPLLVVLGVGAEMAWDTVHDIVASNALPMAKAWLSAKVVWAGILWAAGVLCAFAIPLLLLAASLYLSLRSKEESDWLQDAGPRREVLKDILANENFYAQNHMISVTIRKPGLTRIVTARLAFWLVGSLAGAGFFKPGRLGDIGTIHFARWVTIPGTNQLVFLSNYGGSWESYLEDFITRAHEGLTAVWSNTVGFPYTKNLFQQGATDGERFKRYARHSMLPTPFWYSAYPTLTTANIRTNAAIRCGLAAAMTDEEAITWLALFGSAARPAAKLESNQIQSLVFGGLSFMPHGELLLINFDGEDTPRRIPAARGWLKEIRPEIAFDDGRRLNRDAVLTLALGPGGLARAGLPADALETFPPAYLDGMTGPGRSRILGDHPEEFWWKAEGAYDAAVLVYGNCVSATAALSADVQKVTASLGHSVERVIPLHTIPSKPQDRLEPFKFVDGISQPVIRGTYRGLRNSDPIHLVEPGEFILGYPDNRGNVPPGPTLRALDDPDNRLPIPCDNTGGFSGNAVDLPREIGRNGSFLVIRQLEQDRDAFWDYCEQQASTLKGRLGAPFLINKEFIGAKIVGRWQDGSSLVRNPYTPFTISGKLEQTVTRRPATNPANAMAIAPPTAVGPKVYLAAKSAEARRGPQADPSPDDVKVDASASAAADNDFLFGTEDPEGLRCPFGAHIRRANPRDSLDPGSQSQIDISNRHRIMRIGRSYVPEKGQKDGLMFMCLNGDLERQFEFVQQTWLGSQTFHGLSGERDALAGNKETTLCGLTIPTRDGPLRLQPMSRFVTPRGGGYFFLPGKRLLEFLSDAPP
jgi:deferrochelatase/peroxidase EfeB